MTTTKPNSIIVTDDNFQPSINQRSEISDSDLSEISNRDILRRQPPTERGQSHSNVDQNSVVNNDESSDGNVIIAKKSKCCQCDKKTIIFGSIFIILVIAAVTCFFLFQSEIKGYVDDYVSWMKNHKAEGVFLFATIYALSMPLCIPATLFIIFGAYIFGRVFGFGLGFCIFCIVDYFCMHVGSLLAFWNSRYLFKNCVQSCIESRPKLKAVSLALSYNAKKMVALLRICSITPYYIFNYVCGVTTMSTCDYIIGNIPIFISDIPYIYVCASITDISNISSNPLGFWYYILLAVGLIIVIIVIVLTYCYAKKELNKIMAKIKAENDSNSNRNGPNNIPIQIDQFSSHHNSSSSNRRFAAEV